LPNVLTLSARNPAALLEIARSYESKLADGTAIADACFTANAGRTHFTHRAAVVGATVDELRNGLAAYIAGQPSSMVAAGRATTGAPPKVGFLFTGQGSQYVGMGRGLYESEPVFRAALDRMAATVGPRLERPLLEVMFAADPLPSLLSNTAFTQPALFALEFALTELWRSWGIVPSVVVGHSVGEYAAACAAGVFSPEDGISLIAERGRLMQDLHTEGAMAAVFAPEARVAASLAGHGGRLAIAAVNGPDEIVISGDAPALTEVLGLLQADGVASRKLEVSHAFHSHHLDPMLDALEQSAGKIALSRPKIPLISNLTGSPFSANASPDAGYWRRHAREPVRFLASVNALRAAGVTALLEVGPHPTLLALAERAAPAAPWAAITSLRKGRDDCREMLSSLATLYTRGAGIQWDAVNASRGGRPVPMPTYSFQRERHWIAAPRQQSVGQASPAAHAVFGEKPRQTSKLPTIREPAVGQEIAIESPSGSNRVGHAASAASATNAEPLSIADRLRVEAARILGMPPERVDVGLPLASYGLDSLMTVRLTTEIRQKFGVAISVVDVEQNPTVEMLARLIIEQRPGAKRSPRVVQLQRGSEEPPIYFIYAGPDEVRLARLMGEGRPVFGIEAPWPLRWREAAEAQRKSDLPSMEELVNPHLEALKAHLRSPSCVLAGHSFAGNIAVEVARRHQNQGGRVEAVILFDTYSRRVPLEEVMGFLQERHRKRAASESSRLRALGACAKSVVIPWWLRANRLKNQAIERLRQARGNPTSLVDENGAAVEYHLMVRMVTNILETYRPDRVDTRGVLFRADRPSDPGVLGDDLGWADVFAGGIKIISAGGDHLSMIRSREHNVALALKTSEVLRQIVAG
jgi:malonyl CoA-acyl carrier protein transacylase/thioesterase domain-containing protein/acyl carrier protein